MVRPVTQVVRHRYPTLTSLLPGSHEVDQHIGAAFSTGALNLIQDLPDCIIGDAMLRSRQAKREAAHKITGPPLTAPLDMSSPSSTKCEECTVRSMQGMWDVCGLMHSAHQA